MYSVQKEGEDEEEGGGDDKEEHKEEEEKGPLEERVRQGEGVAHSNGDDNIHQKSSCASLPSPSSSQTCQPHFLQYACPSPSTSTLSSSSNSSYSAPGYISAFAYSHPMPSSSNVAQQQQYELFQRRTYYPYPRKQEPQGSLLPPERYAPAAPWTDDVHANMSSRPCQCDVKNGMNYDFIYGANFRQNRGCSSSHCVNKKSRDDRWVYTIPLSDDHIPKYVEKIHPHRSQYQDQHQHQDQHRTSSRNTNATVATSCADLGSHAESHSESQDVSRLEFDIESALQPQHEHVYDNQKRPFQTRTSYPFRKLSSFRHPHSSLPSVPPSPLPSMTPSEASHTDKCAQCNCHINQPCISSSTTSVVATTATSSLSAAHHLAPSVASMDHPLLKATCDGNDDDDDGDGYSGEDDDNNDIKHVSQPNGVDLNIAFDETLSQTFDDAMSLQ